MDKAPLSGKEVAKLQLMEAIILGFVQGLTEFLPVSSSGHLVLAQYLLGVNSPGAFLEIVLHLGTLISVLIVFWQDVVGLLQGLFSFVTNPGGRRVPRELLTYRRLIGLLLVSLVPTGVIGLLFESTINGLFDSLLAVGVGLLLTGCVLFVISRQRKGKKRFPQMTWVDAAIVGLAQALAIAPGLSRSGMTISAGLSRGLNREAATRYSFLLSLPTIAAISLLKLKDLFGTAEMQGSVGLLIPGFLAAAIFGIIAIKLLVKVMKDGKLQYFSYYVWIVGAIAVGRALLAGAAI